MHDRLFELAKSDSHNEELSINLFNLSTYMDSEVFDINAIDLNSVAHGLVPETLQSNYDEQSYYYNEQLNYDEQSNFNDHGGFSPDITMPRVEDENEDSSSVYYGQNRKRLHHQLDAEYDQLNQESLISHSEDEPQPNAKRARREQTTVGKDESNSLRLKQKRDYERKRRQHVSSNIEQLREALIGCGEPAGNLQNQADMLESAAKLIKHVGGIFRLYPELNPYFQVAQIPKAPVVPTPNLKIDKKQNKFTFYAQRHNQTYAQTSAPQKNSTKGPQ